MNFVGMMQVERFIPNKVILNKAFLFQSLAKENSALVQTTAPTFWMLTSTCPGTPLPLSWWPVVCCSTTTNITDLSNGQVRQDAGKGWKHLSNWKEVCLQPAPCPGEVNWGGRVAPRSMFLSQKDIQFFLLPSGMQEPKNSPSWKQRSLRTAALKQCLSHESVAVTKWAQFPSTLRCQDVLMKYLTGSQRLQTYDQHGASSNAAAPPLSLV